MLFTYFFLLLKNIFCKINSQLERDLHINTKSNDTDEVFYSELLKQKQK
jgi:hypothetical protein